MPSPTDLARTAALLVVAAFALLASIACTERGPVAAARYELTPITRAADGSIVVGEESVTIDAEGIGDVGTIGDGDERIRVAVQVIRPDAVVFEVARGDDPGQPLEVPIGETRDAFPDDTNTGVRVAAFAD